MIIARARLCDVDLILDWRRDLTAWLRKRGELDQWREPLPRSAIANPVGAGQTWLVWDGQEPAATITLTAVDAEEVSWHPKMSGPDRLWWPQDDPTNALYVSRMMVPRRYAGAGLGAEMLDWAGGRAFDSGVLWLRLDAWTTNTRLHDYYLGRGFQYVRTVAVRVSGVCFQRPAQPYEGERLKVEE